MNTFKSFCLYLFVWGLVPAWGLWLISYGIKGGLIDKKIYDYRSKIYRIGNDAMIHGSLQIVAGMGALAFVVFVYMKCGGFKLPIAE